MVFKFIICAMKKKHDPELKAVVSLSFVWSIIVWYFNYTNDNIDFYKQLVLLVADNNSATTFKITRT